MTWKTYLIMYFNSDSKLRMKDIIRITEETGFVTSFGPVDFVYDWKDKVPTKEEIIELGDKVKDMLNGTGTIFNIDTHD